MEQVTVSAYDPQWAAQYEQDKVLISDALSDIVLGIEHIGSTSVPGLGAKPIIDIMVGIQDLDQLKEEHITRLSGIGYEFVHHPDFPERRFFRRGAWRAGTHHLHVYQYKGDHWNKNLNFRNYLIRHPDALEEYYRLKKVLGEKYKHDRAKYTEAKAPFIQHIIGQAMKEEAE